MSFKATFYIGLLCIAFLPGSPAGAQCGASPSPSSTVPPGTVPLELRASLDERAKLFTRAQAEGNWARVAELLGPFYDWNGEPYTAKDRSCTIEQMKAQPLVAPDLEYEGKPPTYVICPPMPVQTWNIVSKTGVQTNEKDVPAKPAYVEAYRDHGQWYFMPGYLDHKKWALAHIPSGQFDHDFAAEVETPSEKKALIEVVVLHAIREREYPDVIRLSFQFRNRTGKRIKIYDFNVTDSSRPGGGVQVGTGAPRDAIPPHGLSRVWEETTTQDIRFCNFHYPARIEIQGAITEDGQEWKAARPSGRPVR